MSPLGQLLMPELHILGELLKHPCDRARAAFNSLRSSERNWMGVACNETYQTNHLVPGNGFVPENAIKAGFVSALPPGLKVSYEAATGSSQAISVRDRTKLDGGCSGC